MQELFEAIKKGDSAALAEVLDRHPSAVDARNENDLSALVVAQYYGRSDLARLLLDRGAQTDMFSACALGLTARAAELLSADRTLLDAYSPDGWTPLHLAAFFGHADTSAVLLENGAKVHALSLNPMRNTPLHAAVARNQTAVTTLLLEKGADVNAKQHGGWTALHAAAANGNVELIRALLAHGAQPYVQAENSQTPLDMALTKGQAEAVRLLEEQRQ